MKRSSVLLYVGSALAAFAAAALVETGARLAARLGEDRAPSSLPALLQSLPHSSISGREIGNQMLVHNVALFAQEPHPQEVDTAYVGTSRTKVIRPRWMGEARAVNSSGNSYNEISYGLLLQAEVARLAFPGLKRVYVEASMLLRRPRQLILEPDHRKYLPVLESLLPLRDQLGDGESFRRELAQAQEAGARSPWRPQLLAHRGELRISNLLPSAAGDRARIPVVQDALFTVLDSRGERKSPPPALVSKGQQAQEITKDHAKVQRLRDIPSGAPWDGLFDLVAVWGQAHGIEIVLFQPPVRSDLYRFKKDMGLEAHVQDLQRVARKYGIPFIDLNRPDLGYMLDWALFSDEDHLETCAGVVLLHSALHMGVERFQSRREVLPLITRADAERPVEDRLRQCREKGAV